MRSAVSVRPANDAAVQERLFGEAARYRDKANVIDHVGDRATFLRRGDVWVRREELGRMTGALLVARLLRNAMRCLGVSPHVLSRLGMALSIQRHEVAQATPRERLPQRIEGILRPVRETDRLARHDWSRSFER